MENVFVVRPFSSSSISWWYAERDQIDFSPAYQRKSGVWGVADRAYLIDSIINGYDVPKFYIADFSYSGSKLNKSGKPYAVIDGRQRLEAIFGFLDGKFRLGKDSVYFADPSVRLAGLDVVELREKHPRILARIEAFPLSVMSVITDQESRINDLFVRLNRSKPLTGAEVRSAMLGAVPGYIKSLADHKFFSRCVSFSNSRKQHENVAAKILLLEHREDFVDTKKATLDRFAAEAILTEQSFERAFKRARSVLRQMSIEFYASDSLLRSSGNLPVYYWIYRSGVENASGFSARDCIDHFEKFRRANPNRKDVAAYNLASRSANDEHTYRTRFNILQKFVSEFSG
ncbi:DUF262 domain-containing protein [Stenotrophomonas maltophilia]|uniref:DUF262 domain-containing protein n=1 Tax=Stenotrophomonas maltophilia group TaxID=995085 RepID=UPI0009B46DCF|nr:DUF262 domain-containing protein [Stenotrophomonas maltophilia]NNH48257.1 DUF262 domain-containing protein [Stenotrophomonas maltophilia]WDW04675.1 DUF262 domain-containing protein [Stenotrophomonas maltophilia]VEE53292.1 Protein of uncharacterised function DUF262 [Stenotrophomonas maltophilia]